MPIKSFLLAVVLLSLQYNSRSAAVPPRIKPEDMTAGIEKGSTEDSQTHPTVETVENAGHKVVSDVDTDQVYSYQEQRKIIHRVDRRLIVSCGLAYCISLMDRKNVSMASIAG